MPSFAFFSCLLPYPQGQQIIIQATPARERSTPRETREALHAVEEEPCYEGHNNKQMELKIVAISPQQKSNSRSKQQLFVLGEGSVTIVHFISTNPTVSFWDFRNA